MNVLLGTDVTAGLGASQVGLESAAIPEAVDQIGVQDNSIGQAGVDSFIAPDTTKFPIGLAPLPLGIFATFLSLHARWQNNRAFLDSMMPVGEFINSLNYVETYRIVRMAGMSDDDLKAWGQSCLEGGQKMDRFKLLPFKMLRSFFKDWLEQCAYSKYRFLVESLLMEMVIRGESAAVDPLARFFRDDETTRFLKMAARTHPSIYIEMMRLSEEKAPLIFRIAFLGALMMRLPPPLEHLKPETGIERG